MSLKPESGWWKTLFDEVYLITDARSVCNDDITCREVDLICRLLSPRPNHEILDLCGGHGRHSLELCARGFTRCTLLDYSQYLVGQAREQACRCGAPLKIVRADARNTGLKTHEFDHVLILGNSMGYLTDNGADLMILKEVFRVLRPGGYLLVDVTDGEAATNNFQNRAWHEIGENIVVCRERELHGDRLRAREMVISKQEGLIRDKNYAIKIYDRDSLHGLLKNAGFKKVAIHGEFSPHGSQGDYGFMNQRMIALGQKLGG